MIIDFLHLTANCVQNLTLTQGLYASLFMAGIVGGFSHCTLMCGPFVMAQNKDVKKLTGALLLPYHLGRITTYCLMALALATVLNMAFLFLPIRSFVIVPVLMLAGTIFLVAAFPSLARLFPWVGRLNIGVPYKYISQGFENLSRKKGMANQYLMGMLLGLMPCGMIVSVLLAALSAPTLVGTVLAVMSFGLGTMPALISVSLGGQVLQRKYPIAFKRVQQGAMLWSGIWLFAIAGFILI